MPLYDVILSVPATVRISVRVHGEESAQAMAEALDSLANIPAGELVELVSLQPVAARIEGCTRAQETPTASEPPVPVEPAGAAGVAPLLPPESLGVYRVKFYDTPEAAREHVASEERELPCRDAARPFAEALLSGQDARYEMRVFAPNGFVVFKAVNPYGPVALVRLDKQSPSGDAGWTVLRGWLDSIASARMAAIEVLDAGHLKAVGIAVRSTDEDCAHVPGRLKVVARLSSQ